MKKSIYLIIFIVYLNSSFALNDLQKDKLDQSLSLAEGNKENYEKVLELLNDKEIDLSNEFLLSERILRESSNLGIDISKYENIKFAETPVPITSLKNKKDFNIESFNLAYPLLIFMLAIILFLILKYKDKLKKESASDTEKQLKNYLKEAKKEKKSNEQIKQELINENWPRDLIDKYL